MLVKDCMSGPVIMVSSIEDVAGAAMKMGHNDVGALPVTDGKKLVGMITDRDIAIRVVGNRNDCSSVGRRLSAFVVTPSNIRQSAIGQKAVIRIIFAEPSTIVDQPADHRQQNGPSK